VTLPKVTVRDDASTLVVVVVDAVPVDELLDEPHEASNMALITNKLSINQVTFLFICYLHIYFVVFVLDEKGNFSG
jgi:hypothetical protein